MADSTHDTDSGQVVYRVDPGNLLLTPDQRADDPDDNPVVEALADRLRDLSYRGRQMTEPEARTYADFLLPAVFALLAEARADELEQAAEFNDLSPSERVSRGAVAELLRVRAIHLRAAVRRTEGNDR